MHLLYVSHHCQKVPSTNPQPYISVQPPLQYSQDTAAAAAAAAASIECIVVKRETFTDSLLHNNIIKFPRKKDTNMT